MENSCPATWAQSWNGLGFVACVLLLCTPVSAKKNQLSPPLQSYQDQGISIDFTLSPLGSTTRLVAGSEALARFSVHDARNGQPITGLHPKAWINGQLPEPLASETSCKDKIRGFLAGQLATRPDIDLNAYLAMTLNSDKTIAFINPQISFNATKLQNLITLPANGSDWVLSSNREFLYVTMPEAAAVAIVDTSSKTLLHILATGEASQPHRIALQPDGHSAWVGLDGSSQLAVIDTTSNSIAGEISIGNGLHNIAFTADSHFAYVTNSSDNTVSIIDMQKRARIADLAVDQTPIAIAYGSAAGLIYVAAINGASIVVIDPDQQKVVARIPMKHGVSALGFEPSGRYALAVNQIDSTVTVIDSVNNSIMGSTQVVKEPDQISFTQRYAYVRGLGSEKFSLIDLNEMKSGKFNPVDIQAGRQPPSNEPQEIGVSSMIVPTPEGDTVMVANAPDRTMYFYQEGMMAPMGTFSNYDRIPHAVMILDRSLRETAPGTYTAVVKLTKGGDFDVPILIDQPRLINCFRLSIDALPSTTKAQKGTGLIVDLLKGDMPLQAHKPTRIKIRLTDRSSRQPVIGLSDARALIFEPPGIWQQRRPALEVGDGIYEIDQTFPHAGVYNLMITVASRGVTYADLPLSDIAVESGD